MKLIEGMKRLRVIEKRMASNIENINRYAAILSTERPMFGSEDKQRSEVKALIQANRDLMDEYLILKKRIERTNLGIEIEIQGTKYQISDLLIIKRKLAKMMESTYSALNTKQAELRMTRGGMQAPVGERIQVVPMFDETDKNTQLRLWQDLYDNIDSRLEVINATAELLEITDKI